MPELSLHDVIDRFTQAMRALDIETEATIQADGQRHRFRVTGDKAGSENGWYVLHMDGVPAGAFGCWKRGISETWCAKSASGMTDAERQALHERMDASRRAQEAEQARIRAECKAKAERLWSEAAEAVSASHPYLVAKGVKSYGLRQLRDALVVPVRADAGGLVGLQFIQPDGTKRFLAGTPKAGSYHRITGSMERVLICEGYATGASLHEATGCAVAIAFDAGNLMAVATTLRDKLPDAELVLCADDDRHTEGNPGKTKATAAARAVGGLLAVPTFHADDNGTDFNDMHQRQGIDAVLAAVEAAAVPENLKKPEAENSTNLNICDASPDHIADADNMVSDVAKAIERHAYAGGEYQLGPRGVFFTDDKGDSRWICAPLHIIAKTRDGKSVEWGRLLQWQDDDHVTHRWAMPMELLQGDGSDMRRELARQGLQISPTKTARDHLASYLQVWPTDQRARCVDRLGWHGNVYLTPGEAIGADDEIVVFQNAHALEPALSVSGTAEDWRDSVAKLAADNSRMVFALSVAFAGPLAAIAGEGSGGFHLRGASSSGKSTALKAAASVWGSPDAYLRLWRATANGLEGLAALHNDNVLVLDELSQIDPREAGEAAYMLANGQGKARASRSGAARQAARWRVLFLSAGEVSLSTLIASTGKRTNAGQEVRLADIPADAGAGHGAFEVLHGFTAASVLADALTVAVERYHGAVGLAWLHHIVESRQALADLIAEGVRDFVAEAVPTGASGQVARVARRFGLVAVAGELASHYGLTGWREGMASAAVARCFADWLEGFGGTVNREQQTMLAQVRGFFESHGSSRFEGIDATHDQRVPNRAGFYRDLPAGGREYLVLPGVFKDEVCKGIDHKAAAKELAEHGWIKTESDGGKTVSTVLPGMGKSRVYAFMPAMWRDAA